MNGKWQDGCLYSKCVLARNWMNFRFCWCQRPGAVLIPHPHPLSGFDESQAMRVSWDRD